jgi:hypothetical protein
MLTNYNAINSIQVIGLVEYLGKIITGEIAISKHDGEKVHHAIVFVELSIQVQVSAVI